MAAERLQWSKYFQTPEYLELTRKFLIPDELRPTIMKQIGVKAGTKVLDLGCGTGFFSRFIAESEPQSHVTGLEYDENFVAYAKEQSARQGLDITFVQGDAMDLPFEDASFDAVTGHTFLNSVSDPDKAMDEMKRVCRIGGVISSVTPMSFQPTAVHGGNYPLECDWTERFVDLNQKMWTMYNSFSPVKNYISPLSLPTVPHFFAGHGLKNIAAFPIGQIFSLSNARISYEERLEYLALEAKAERDKLEAFMELEDARAMFSREEADEYLSLLQKKHEYYISHPDENSVWEWRGGANLLVSGLNVGDKQ